MSKRKREIVKSHFAANLFEQAGELGLGCHTAHVTHKRVNPVEHPPSRRTAQTIWGTRSKSPSPWPPFLAPPRRVSTGAPTVQYITEQ